MPPVEYTKEYFDKQIDLLVDKMHAYDPKVDGSVVHAAFDYALSMHGVQTRESGEPYVVHPLKVAEILADMEMDQTTIVAALLHDCIEDTKASFENIEQQFGADVARLVDGVTKLDGIEFRTKDEQKAESLRKMFFAMAKDIRVVIIKLADRLHNMRTLKFCKEHGIVVEAYSPLGHGSDMKAEPIQQAAEAHDVTPAQVVLRWHVQSGRIVIPKSTHAERMRQNLDVFSFELTDEEMQSISALHDPANRVGADPATFVQSQSWANQKSRGNIPD